MSKKIDRTGEKKTMNCGMVAEIISYRNANDIDVRFENGDIMKNKTYSSFKKGNITNKPFNGKERVGEIVINKRGERMELIEWHDSYNVTIKFDNGYVLKNIVYHNFKKGKVKNPFGNNVFNIGYIGDTKTTDENGKKLKSYVCWCSMLQRCYDIDCETYKKYGKKGVIVCEEWLHYSNFKEWYDRHYYEVEGEKVALDKDIFSENNKIYSPKTCIFVPQKINALFMSVGEKKDNLPRGVLFRSGKYESSILINGTKKYLGRYDSIEEAKNAYDKERSKYVRGVVEQYQDKIPKKVYNKLIKRIKEVI